MKKILLEIGRVEEEQISSLDKFFLSSFEVAQPNKTDRNPEENTDADNESDSSEVAEREAGVINWTDESTTAEDSSEEINERKLKRGRRWLQCSLVATTGNADVIVFALAQKIVVLEKNGSVDGKYEVTGQFSIRSHLLSHFVYIRSICVLPLAATRKTETRDYDFVSIAVGLSNGHVHFYTERGVLLRSEKFSHKPIDAVRFGRSVLPGEQELVVFVAGHMTVIDGLSLYVALKSAKIQIARGEEDIQKIATTALLNVERIRLTKEMVVSDLAVLGPYEQPYAETYAAASVSPAGPRAQVDCLAPPLFTTYVFTGPSPFVAFGWNRVGAPPPTLFTDILYNYGTELMSNVVSSLPSFGLRSLFGSRNEQPPQTQRDQSTENRAHASRVSTKLEMRSIFEDGGREGERLFPAPSGNPFVAVTDSFARVLLFDTRTRLVRRIWKGYRDARCAWIESEANSEIKGGLCNEEYSYRKKTLFLILFAPRRGLLEVWPPLNGKRVAAINIEQKGRLMSCLRAHDSTLGNLALVPNSLASAFFFSPDGKVYKIEVPFYLALMHESTATIHDESILKEMRQLSKGFDDLQLQQFISFMCTLRTPVALREALEMAVKNRSVTVDQYSKILDTVLEYMDSRMLQFQKSSTDCLALHKYVDVLAHLLSIYMYLYNYHTNSHKTDDADQSREEPLISVLTPETEDVLETRFRLDKKLLTVYLNQIRESCKCESNDKEMTSKDFHFIDFLTSFDISKATSLRRCSTESPSLTAFDLSLIKPSSALGYFMFAPALKEECRLDEFKTNVLQKIGLSQLELLDIFCSFWLTSVRISSFSLLQVLTVCEELAFLTENRFHWLSMVEDRLHSCYEVAPAFFLCLVARAIALSRCSPTPDIVKPKDVTVSETDVSLDVSDEWENIETYVERWDVLLKNLQCIALLKCLPLSPKTSLQEFADAGKAFYRERLGSWVSAYKPNPAHFNAVITIGGSMSTVTERSNECWVKPVSRLLSLFPYSMKSVFVFCDCAWECVNAWKRDPDKKVDVLKYALEFISLLKDSQYLQHAICLLLWETHLREPFKGLYEWLNKAGKSPKDRLARKHVGLGENQLVDFVKCCLDVLRTLRTTADQMDCLSLEIKYEDFVDAYFDFHKGSKRVRREALVKVLLRQYPAIRELALHHYDLACVFELQLTLSIHLQPAKLFDDELAERALFAPLNKKRAVPIQEVVATVRHRRQEFVEKCTTVMTEKQSGCQRLYDLVDSLVHDWALDMDGVALKEMESLLILGDQPGILKSMYRVRFPEIVVQRCYPYLNARMRAYIKEYCPDLIERARRRGQWARWTQSALKTASGENIKLVRAPTMKEMVEFVNVLQNFACRMTSSTEDLAIQVRVIDDMANVLKFAPQEKD